MKAKTDKSTRKRKEIVDYDSRDTTSMIDRRRPLSLEKAGLELPKAPPTQRERRRTA